MSLRRLYSQTLEVTKRCFSLTTSFRTNAGDGEKKYTEGELKIMGTLRAAFPDAFSIQVLDVSGWMLYAIKLDDFEEI